MAISYGQYTVSTEPVAVNTVDEDGVLVIINANQNVYLGNADVTISTGYLHSKTDPPLHLDLAPNEIVYAIRAGSQDAIVTTLRTHNT